MKLILLCIAVGATTATSFSNVVGHNPNPAQPTYDNDHDDHRTSTATWKENSSSTKQQGSHTDHEWHQASMDGFSDPIHGNDTRVLSSFSHTRHPNLESADECDAIKCTHEFRMYNNVRTSSIVVTHVCHNTTGDSDPNGLASWGAQFKTNLADTAAMTQAKKHCAVETKCKTGHVCGIVFPNGQAQCQCHSWNHRAVTHYPDANAPKPFDNSTVDQTQAQVSKADGVGLDNWTQP